MYGNLYPSGLNPGKVIEIGDNLASTLDDPAGASQLFGGAYQFVKVDSGATASNVQTGRLAFYKLDPGGTAGVQPEAGWAGMVVTDQANADAATLWAGVFINPITPGNWGFIFVGGGRVDVQYAASFTNGTGAIGDVVGVKASGTGLVDDISAVATGAWSGYSVGIAVTAPVVNGMSAIYMPNIRYRIPTV